MKTLLIYCAGSNRKYAEIALGAGFAYGARLPDLCYFEPTFCDQDFKRPDRAAYMVALETSAPRLATVLDWDDDAQLPEVLSWAEEAAALVSEAVIIIPKVSGGISQLPRRIGGREVRLGYSVPTSYGGTNLMLWEFSGWPVHLLGGSPKNQLRIARYLDVQSADGNYIHHKIRFGQFFDGTRWRQLKCAGYDAQGADIPAAVLSLSLPNIYKLWSLS